MNDDRRQKPRHPWICGAVTRIAGEVVALTSIDLSASGAFFASQVLPALQTLIDIVLKDPPEEIRALRLGARVVRVIPPGHGYQPGFAVRWIFAESSEGVRSLGQFLTEDLGVISPDLKVSPDGRRSHFDFPGAAAAMATASGHASQRPSPFPVRPASQASRPASQASRPASQASRPASQASRPASQASRPASQASRPASQASRPASQALRSERIGVKRSSTTKVSAMKREVSPAPRSSTTATETSEIAPNSGQSWWERASAEPNSSSNSGLSRQKEPASSSEEATRGIGRLLRTATGRLFGDRDEQEQKKSGQSALFADIQLTGQVEQPVSEPAASTAPRSASKKKLEVDSRIKRLPKRVSLDPEKLLRVEVPTTYYVHDTLVPAKIMAISEEGVVIQSRGPTPRLGETMRLHLPLLYEGRYVTLQVEGVLREAPTRSAREQLFSLWVLQVNHREVKDGIQQFMKSESGAGAQLTTP